MNDAMLDKIEQYLNSLYEEDGSISEEVLNNSSLDEVLSEHRHFLEESFDEGLSKKQQSRIERLINRIDEIWKECDFFDPEAELDMMYPDRHDEESDEAEDMSISAFFGE